ncbi:putative ATP-dependent RNA helicase dhr2 [Agyrium rufum]|nr:putative ATP-dependent RNA helicase dhr2 [Agyrium rufum]
MPPKVHRRFSEDGEGPINSTLVFGDNAPLQTTSASVSKKRKRYTTTGSEEVAEINGTSNSLPRSQGLLKSSTANEPHRKGNGTSEAALPTSVNAEEAKPSGTQSTRPKPKSFQQTRTKLLRNGHAKPTQDYPRLRDRAQALEPMRKKLPIWSHAAEIRAGLRDRNVMLLVGETGSGKSTQTPQFFLNEPWCQRKRVDIPSSTSSAEAGGDGKVRIKRTDVGGCIAITQPRRVAAITLARRVAEEMGTPLGSSSPASKVGYSVRFDNSTSPSTRIKYLTEGMLLQEMLRDPWLRQYSAVVVDEVHERGVNVDLILGFLRNMVKGSRKEDGRGGVPMKVVVMSATADMQGLKAFFEDGNTNPKEILSDNQNLRIDEEGKENAMERSDGDESEWSGFESSDDQLSGGCQTNGYQSKSDTTKATTGGLQKISNVSTIHIEGRQFPVKVIHSPQPVQDYLDAALQMIFKIHYREPLPGDVLVFLTGQETIESLEVLLNEYALNLSSDIPKFLVLPLFAALPQAAQQRVFQPAPPKTRKVILATNIAETSVTVSGVRFVIDCGKSKIKQFRTRLGLDSLLVKPISKSAALQRTGRAGREAPGQCYRLYTGNDFEALPQDNTPEILRCDLSQAILNMKARGVGDIMTFPFLDQPPRDSLEKALMQLFQLGALSETGDISELGLQIAKLPLSAPLGRVLLAAAEPEADCLAEVVDIISCLSVENVFLNLSSEEAKEQAESARRSLFRREGDHLTLLATVQAYASENADRKAWAEKHFVSHRAMQAVMDVRKQLRSQCKIMKLGTIDEDDQRESLSSERASALLKCFLNGFATNTARLMPDGSYRTMVGNQTVAIHPSSGLFGKKVEAIMYNEYVFTNRSYARGVSAVQMDWIGEALGAR